MHCKKYFFLGSLIRTGKMNKVKLIMASSVEVIKLLIRSEET